jgi:hypothetical protein
MTIEGEIWTSDDDVDDYEWEYHVPADQVPGLASAAAISSSRHSALTCRNAQLLGGAERAG